MNRIDRTIKNPRWWITSPVAFAVLIPLTICMLIGRGLESIGEWVELNIWRRPTPKWFAKMQNWTFEKCN